VLEVVEHLFLSGRERIRRHVYICIQEQGSVKSGCGRGGGGIRGKEVAVADAVGRFGS
jgi:hypothetical protein